MLKKLPKKPYYSKAFKKDNFSEIERYVHDLHEYIVSLDKVIRVYIEDENNIKMNEKDKIEFSNKEKVTKKEFFDVIEQIKNSLNNKDDDED